MKKIYPINVFRCILVSIWLAFLALAISTMICIVIEQFKISNSVILSIFGFICAILMAIFTIYALIEEFKKRINFNDDEIYVAKDGSVFGFMRILQYELHIDYNEITDIYLYEAARDSNNKEQFGLFTLMPYIVFECKDGNKKLINAYYYNRKQRAAIIDEAIIRADALGNHLDISSGTEIITKFYSKPNKK